jgi:hypothetical protein
MKHCWMKRSFAEHPFAEQNGMKLKRTCCGILLALALAASIFFVNPSMHAQTPSNPPAAQKPGGASNENSEQNSQHTFTGVIAKHGDKLVLTDPLTQTSYQLDDQRRAEELVSKNVKVTGVLDPSTGTIRVSAIDPL